MDDRRSLGKTGEDLAAQRLAALGWMILERNYRCRLGEIDIIARDRDTLVFVEVKTRASRVFGGALSAISAAKRRRIRRLADHYMVTARTHHGSATAGVRFDLIAVSFEGRGAPAVSHVRDIF